MKLAVWFAAVWLQMAFVTVKAVDVFVGKACPVLLVVHSEPGRDPVCVGK